MSDNPFPRGLDLMQTAQLDKARQTALDANVQSMDQAQIGFAVIYLADVIRVAFTRPYRQ